MQINWSGIAAAYQGYQDQQRRVDDDARRSKVEQRQEQDNQFTEQARSQQRRDWAREEQTRQDDEASRQQLASQASALLPAVAGLPAAPSGAERIAPANGLAAAGNVASKGYGNSVANPVANSVANTVAPPAAAVAAPLSAAPAKPSATNHATLPLAPAGIPAPHNFNHTLDQQRQFLNGKLARGTLSTHDYSNAVAALNRMQTEGIGDALRLMAQGRYDEALAHYNQNGQMRGAKIMKGEAGTTQINGQAVPTHFVTLQNPDGSHSIMDVARAQYQMLDINSQLALADKARHTEMTRQHHAESAQLGRAQLAQQAKDAAASRAISGGHLSLAMQQFYAGTGPGIISAKEKALGRPLTGDERATLLGVDSMPPAQRLQLQSNLKEQDQLAQAIIKAQAEGTWQETGPDGKSNPLLVRQAALIGQRRLLLQGGAPTGSGGTPLGSNPLGLNLPGAAPAGRAAESAIPSGNRPLLTPAAGVARAAAPATAPAAAAPAAAASAAAPLPEGAVDLRNDPILLSLRKSIRQLDAQNPAHSQAMMALGTALNQRLDQLQQMNGSKTQLITE